MEVGVFLSKLHWSPSFTKDYPNSKLLQEKGQFPGTAQADWPNEKIIVQP